MTDIPELTVDQVAARLREPGFHVFDNNSPARWKRSHVPGAINVNAYDYPPEVLPADREATLVFYCAGPG
jgi:rhodanese-related sulfurtransferase